MLLHFVANDLEVPLQICVFFLITSIQPTSSFAATLRGPKAPVIWYNTLGITSRSVQVFRGAPWPKDELTALIRKQAEARFPVPLAIELKKDVAGTKARDEANGKSHVDPVLVGAAISLVLDCPDPSALLLEILYDLNPRLSLSET
ncbi:hypothetical protein RhiXN_00272 [Rhizoctonia solani]|uniref:Uncharacterized protein n=1 Tax=Rhizoctonia solani TaxID=456999 RepID=A0A8H8SUF6_9AGAM|nr:uncharacterized protein RhiXN_00272 [Rhizoctonia solani]QRW18866.1 hypothetical protein RhiXN_00272 [Rhizoctonia solani]